MSDYYDVRVSIRRGDTGELMNYGYRIAFPLLDDAFRPLPKHRHFDPMSMMDAQAMSEKRRRAIDMLATDIAQALAVHFDKIDEGDDPLPTPVPWPGRRS